MLDNVDADNFILVYWYIIYRMSVCARAYMIYFINCGHSPTVPSLYIKLYYKYLYLGNNSTYGAW